MKRALLSIATLTLLATTASAQITIADTSFGTIVGTTDVAMRANASSFVQVIGNPDHINIAHPSGYTWNINSVYYANDTLVANRVYARHVAATGYDYADSLDDAIGTYTFKNNVLAEMAPSGLWHHGQHINAKSFSIPGGTPGVDSLYIFDQNDMYYATGFTQTLEPRLHLKFPLKMDSTWNNNYFYEVKASVNYAPMGYVNDTLSRKRIIVDGYSVIGYGNMRVRSHTGGGAWSDYFNVLQVRCAFVQTTDSFFLNGVALTPAELSLFGLTQGVQTLKYSDQFYRAGEVIPFVDVHYTDASRNVVQNAGAERSIIAAQNLNPSSVGNVVRNNNFAIYPNPVKGGSQLAIDVQDATANGNWTYNITNVAGQQIATGSLNFNGGKANISVPKAPRGIYYIQASNGDQKIVKAMDIE
jgi:hypothetical protein